MRPIISKSITSTCSSNCGHGFADALGIIRRSDSRTGAMNENMPFRNGGRILVDQLQLHGTDTAFCVPGESYLAVLDALYGVRERVRLIVCRQEGGAAV